MTHTRYAFIKAAWHADIVDQALVGFQEKISPDQVDVFTVPGAFEMPLLAKKLGDGLMQAGIDTGVPVLSVSLTPHHFQPTDHHIEIYKEHFVTKGREAAEAALQISALHAEIS